MKEISPVTSIIRRVHLIALLVLLCATTVFAQNTANAGVTVNASVIQGLVVGSVSGPLNFGNSNNIIVKGAVAASDTSINVSTDSRAVYFSVQGDGAQSITVTYPASISLGTGVTFSPTTQYTSSTTQSGGTSFTSGTQINLSGTLYSTATKYIWVGGTLTGASTAAPGTYSGTLTLTVAYYGI